MLVTSLSAITVGFGLGLMHALDADHVMAVSSMSNNKPGFWRSIRYASHWALGHGGVLLASGLLLFGLGFAIPESLQHLAEMSVGVLLIGLGLHCFWRFRRDDLELIRHHHGDIEHVHWQLKHQQAEHAQKTGEDAKKAHTPVMVGMLHGLAGSAPALALVPAVAEGALLSSLLYLLVFSIGVMIAMVVFGLGFGAMQQQLQQRFKRIFQLQRLLVASLSIALGGFWLSQTV